MSAPPRQLALAWLLRLKIGATLLLWALPLIVLPASMLQRLGLPDPGAAGLLFLRLLGWAWLALCVGYAGGLWALARGQSIATVVWMGIASNGAAAGVLASYGLAGAWAPFGQPLQALLWLSLAGAALIAAGLAWLGLRRG